MLVDGGGTLPARARFLSSLEVEVLDGEGEDDGEEDAEAGDHGGDDAEEVVAEPEVLLEERRHGGGGGAVGEQQGLVQVAELRRQEAVERPRHRVGPVVPPPPHGDALRVFSTENRTGEWSVLLLWKNRWLMCRYMGTTSTVHLQVST